ncbi:MAG TPA: DUF4440 domain-containing protein [Hanamia sp.]|nr:DUF4440 domain-containing protein [Hanamia sp.]
MKKIILILLIAISVFNINSFGQTKTSGYEKLKEQIIVSEKAGWEAWKNKNAEWFKINTTKDFLNVSRDGISNKAKVVKSTATDCDVKSVSIDNFTFVGLNKETVVLTYIAYQDGVCGNSRLPSKIRVSATYVKQVDKWLEAFYMEAVVSE